MGDSRIEVLEKDIENMSGALSDIEDNQIALNNELKDIKLKFKSFYMAILKNIPKKVASKVFEEYQKNTFSQIK